NCDYVDQTQMPAPRQEMDQQREQIVLDGEPAVRGLYKVTDPDPRNLPGELFLPQRVAHMLNHRIAEHHVERLVPERELQSVAENPFKAVAAGLHGARKIEHRYLRPDAEQSP